MMSVLQCNHASTSIGLSITRSGVCLDYLLFACLVVTFLSLCPKYTNEQLCVMYTEIQSLKNSNNTKHIEERIRRFCSGSVSKSG